MNLRALENKHYILFNGENLLQKYGAVMWKDEEVIASRSYDEVEIPGRNGALLRDNGTFPPVSLPYNGFITGEGAYQRFMLLRNALCSTTGEKVLVDPSHPDEFMKAHFRSFVDVEATNSGVSFTANFTADPRHFLFSGQLKKKIGHISEVSDNSDYKFYNSSFFTSFPLIYIEKSPEDAYMYMFLHRIELTRAITEDDHFVINCEKKNAYNSKTGEILTDVLNFTSVNDFPYIYPNFTYLSYFDFPAESTSKKGDFSGYYIPNTYYI